MEETTSRELRQEAATEADELADEELEQAAGGIKDGTSNTIMFEQR